jgi:hypothetical protein
MPVLRSRRHAVRHAQHLRTTRKIERQRQGLRMLRSRGLRELKITEGTAPRIYTSRVPTFYARKAFRHIFVRRRLPTATLCLSETD